MPVHPFQGHVPEIDAAAWVAPSATVIGRVTLAAQSSVFYNAVVRGDVEDIAVGERSNLQDAVVVHADPGSPCRIGAGVSVGHAAVLHGCTIGDGCLIGMSATVLNGADIGAGSLVAAGAVVLAGTVVPPGSLVAGVPAKVRRPLDDGERTLLTLNAEAYVALGREHAELG